MRRLVIWIAVLTAIVALAIAGAALWLYLGADTSDVEKLGFANELRVPPLPEPRSDGGGRTPS